MPTIYFDWGRGKVTTLLDDDTEEQIVHYPSTDAVLDSLTEPTTIISEATFESYEPVRRAAIIQRAQDEGHLWLTTPNRQTARHRAEIGYEKKTDEIDVQVIRSLALSQPDGLKAPNVRGAADPVVMNLGAANMELMHLRREYRMVSSPRKRLPTLVSAKDDYAKAIIELLPDFAGLFPERQAALGDPGSVSARGYRKTASTHLGYRMTLVAALAKATKFSRNRGEFDQLAGMFAHGYPSQIRSDVHHWTWRMINKREDNTLTLSQFRRECRFLFHRLDELRSVL